MTLKVDRTSEKGVMAQADNMFMGRSVDGTTLVIGLEVDGLSVGMWLDKAEAMEWLALLQAKITEMYGDIPKG